MSEPMLPIFSTDDPAEKDERFEGVILLSQDDENKTTAEDCGDYWYIRDWEVDNFKSPQDYWFTRCGWAIDKSVVKQLYEAQS